FLEAAPGLLEVGLAMLSEGRDPMSDRPAPGALVLDHGMAVAQIERYLMRGPGKVAGADVDSDVAEEAEVTLMGRQAMVAVVAVFDQQFPVGARAVGLLARHDLHPDFRLIGDKIEILPRAGKIVRQTLGVPVEAGKDESAVARDLGGRCQREFIARERIAIGLLARHAHQLSAIVERPGVIRTLKGLRVAGPLAAHEGAAMRAGVEQHANRAVVAAHQDHRAPGYLPRPIVARVRDFRFMAHVDPASIEDPPPLLFETFGINERPAIDAKDPSFAVIDDVPGGCFFHEPSPLWSLTPDPCVSGPMPSTGRSRRHRRADPYP